MVLQLWPFLKLASQVFDGYVPMMKHFVAVRTYHNKVGGLDLMLSQCCGQAYYMMSFNKTITYFTINCLEVETTYFTE